MIETILASLFAVVGSALVSFFIVRYFTSRYSGLEVLSDNIGSFFSGEDGSQIVEGIRNLSYAAHNLNVILTNDEALDSLMTDLAGKIRKSMVGAMMGVKSGDAKREAKAEEMLDRAMVEGAKNINPVIGLILRATGLDKELEQDPQMIGYIMQALGNRGGLMELFQQVQANDESLAVPSGGSNMRDFR